MNIPWTSVALSLVLTVSARATEVFGTVTLKSAIVDRQEAGKKYVFDPGKYQRQYLQSLGAAGYSKKPPGRNDGPAPGAYDQEDKVSLTVIEIMGIGQKPSPWLKELPGKNVMDQQSKSFQPRVLAVPAGSKVFFTNLDSFAHHIYAPQGRDFDDISNHMPRRIESRTFPESGEFRLFCGIHPRMSAWVYVGESNFLARPDAKHTFRIPAVPPGKYKIRAWHPLLAKDPVESNLVVPAEGKLEFNIEL